MHKINTSLILTFLILASFGCTSLKKDNQYSSSNISYQDENYVIPLNEIWKLTWKSPYKGGDIHPAYDVRILGKAYTSKDRSTIINAFSHKTGSNGLLDIQAGKNTATIWIAENTEFYIANKFIEVSVEKHNLNTIKGITNRER